MRKIKSKWNAELRQDNCEQFIDTHKLGILYETAYQDYCLIHIDCEGDPFLIKITDVNSGEFEILTNMTYLSLNIDKLVHIHNIMLELKHKKSTTF